MTELALPTLPQVERREPAAPSPEWLAAAKRARWLSWLSLVWMGLEGGIALFAGVVAGSIALIGFGIDSTIEGVASVIIIWRFTGARMLSHAAEERAQKLVAIQFFLLAPYVGYEAVSHLISAERPEVSVLGMLLTTSSLIGMPLLGRAKQRVALQARFPGNPRRGHAESALRLSGRGRTGGSRRQCAVRRLVAGPHGGAIHCRRCRARGDRDLARRGLLHSRA